MTYAGDYDYEDGHNVPAGCQYLVSSSEQLDLGGNVSAPVPAFSNTVAAETVPLQAPAPSTHTTNIGFHYNASAPALMRTPSNSIAKFAAQAAGLNSTTLASQAQVKLLCKPVAAKGDPGHLS